MRWRAREDERGAAAIFLALVICFVLLPITAFAVDIGMQRVTRRDAQAVADAAAQDAARALGAGTTARADLETIAQTTATSSSTALGGTPVVSLQVGTLSSTFKSDQSLGCGSSTYNSYFTQTPAGTVPDAVLVVVRNSVSFSFYGGDGGVCRSAIARAYKTACMVMDSYAAALRTGESSVLGPLLKILGSNIDATALSGSGILTTDVDLVRFLNLLKTRLGVGSVSEVLTTQITAADLIAAEAAALTQQGGTAAATVGVLNSQLGTKVGSLLGKFTVGELLGIAQGGTAALGTTINAFDLAAAAVQLANGSKPLVVDVGLPAGLTGASKVNVTVGSRPTRVCLGDGQRSMGQTSVSVSANLLTPGSIVGDLVSSLTGVVNGVLCGTLGAVVGADCYDIPTVSLGPLTASVSLASASGEVLSLNCTGAVPNSLNIKQAASLAPTSVRIPLTFSQTRTFGPLYNRKSETVVSTFAISADTDAQDTSRSGTLNVPGDYDTSKAGPSGNLSVPSLTLSTSLTENGQFSNGTSLVGGTLSGVSALVNLVSSKLLSPLLSKAVDPLVTALTQVLKSTVGLTVAGSSYTPLRTPGCGVPSLAG